VSEFYIYETHPIKDPLLPFIFHPKFVRTLPARRINWHENIEFLYCTEGSGYVQYGPEQIPFSQGDLTVVNADTLHCVGSDSVVTYQCLIVDRSFFLDNGIPVTDLTFQKLIRDPIMAQIFADVAQAFENYDPNQFLTIVEIRHCVLAFIRQLCRCYCTKRNAVTEHPDHFVKQTIVYIRNHLAQPITLDLLAAHTGLSKYHLSRQFKNATGKTIIEYVNLARCLEAKHQIENGATVSAAALSCGYENLSYFSRTYKKLLGELPSDAIRKQ